MDEAQRKKVTEWIGLGLKLAEIQKQLESEFGLRLTYMDVRFLVDDLKLVPKDPEPPKTLLPTPTSPSPTVSPAPVVAPEPDATSSMPGGVSVAVDKIARPGALVSGKVTFSDGNKADWHLDQTGRLGLAPQVQGYRPSGPDVQQFQIALESELSKMGF